MVECLICLLCKRSSINLLDKTKNLEQLLCQFLSSGESLAGSYSDIKLNGVPLCIFLKEFVL